MNRSRSTGIKMSCVARFFRSCTAAARETARWSDREGPFRESGGVCLFALRPPARAARRSSLSQLRGRSSSRCKRGRRLQHQSLQGVPRTPGRTASPRGRHHPARGSRGWFPPRRGRSRRPGSTACNRSSGNGGGPGPQHPALSAWLSPSGRRSRARDRRFLSTSPSPEWILRSSTVQPQAQGAPGPEPGRPRTQAPLKLFSSRSTLF
jgi:hypothetical protein